MKRLEVCLPDPLSFGEESWRSRKALASSWGASLTAHVLLIGTVILVHQALPPQPQPEAVTWQVLLVDSDGSEDERRAEADQSLVTDAAAGVPSQPTSGQPGSLPQVTEAGDSDEIRTIQTPPPSFLSERVEHPPEVVGQDIRTAPADRGAAMTEEMPHPEAIREATAPTVSAESESEPAVVARLVTAESSVQDPPPAPVPSAGVPEPMVPAISAIPESEHSEVAAPLRTTAVEPTFSMPDTAGQDAKPAEEDTHVHAPARQGTGPSEPGSKDQQQVANRASEPARPLRDSPNDSSALVGSSKTRDADYGWLVRSIRGRILDLKQYPVEARLNRYEGRVVVRAVIGEAGELLDVSVALSSGHDVLDYDAIDLMRKVCPIKLSEPLRGPVVVVKVPVNYSLRH